MRRDVAASGTAGRWVAVNTHPQREQIAFANLVRQGFDTYCPKERRSVRHARCSQTVLRPLFPGYLFVQVNPDLRRWRPILSTYGVRTMVRCGEQLSTLDNGFIEALKAREVEGVIVKPETPFRIGQRVRLTDGPFDGLVARIVDVSAQDRLIVLMDLLNRSVRVKVAAEGVRAI